MHDSTSLSRQDAAPHLIILTCQGRLDYLRQVLNSLSPSCRALFSRCFISVNGPEPYLYHVKELLSSLGMADCFNILTTGRFVSSVHHFKCWTSTLSNYVHGNSRLLLFADDDLFNSSFHALDLFLQSLYPLSDTVGLSRYYHFSEDGNILLCKLPLEPSSSCAPSELVRHAFHIPFSMNITGMLLPFSVIKDSTNFLFSFASYGRRTELVYITHPSINRVRSSSDYLAKVRIHNNRESSKLLLVDPAYDELIFILWLWRHRPELRPLYSSDPLPSRIVFVFLRSLAHCLWHPLFLIKKILLIVSRFLLGPGSPSVLVLSPTSGTI